LGASAASMMRPQLMQCHFTGDFFLKTCPPAMLAISFR